MIVKQHENKLEVVPDGWEAFIDILVPARKGIWIGFLILVFAAQEGWMAFIIASIVVILMIWLFVSISFDIENAYQAIFDRDAQIMTVTSRSPWLIWLPRKKTFQIKNLAYITLSKSDEKSPRLCLFFKGGLEITFAGSATADAAETISRFLKIPLRIEMDEQRITHMPWVSDKEGNPLPTPCAKCGAPLPLIEAGMKNIKCTHCGMTMVIEWNGDRLSYKARE